MGRGCDVDVGGETPAGPGPTSWACPSTTSQLLYSKHHRPLRTRRRIRAEGEDGDGGTARGFEAVTRSREIIQERTGEVAVVAKGKGKDNHMLRLSAYEATC